MSFKVNFKSGLPVYLQIVEQVKAAAASGALRAGEVLPSIRPLSEELRVNRNTVAKAYTELENLGVIETQPGRGCFLSENQSALKKDARLNLLARDVDQAIVQAHHLQISRSDFMKLVEERLNVLDESRRSFTHREEES